MCCFPIETILKDEITTHLDFVVSPGVVFFIILMLIVIIHLVHTLSILLILLKLGKAQVLVEVIGVQSLFVEEVVDKLPDHA